MNRKPSAHAIRLASCTFAILLFSTLPITTRATGKAPLRQAASTGNRVAANQVTDIDFQRGPGGVGNIRITLSNPGSPIRVDRRHGRIIATIPDTYLPKHLQKHLDVLDFATPVRYVDMYSRDGDTRIMVTPIDHMRYQRATYQSGNQFTLQLKPAGATGTEMNKATDTPKFTGRKISLSLQKVSVRSVLQTIADVANVNMVVSSNVTGDITLQLDDVPWDQALNIILRSQGLGMRRIGNVINIAPLSQIAKRKNAERAAAMATQNTTPLQSEIIQINYANAADIAHLVHSGSGQAAMLSERGQVAVDERTNSLLITDTTARLQAIRNVINELDVPVHQVLIQSRIVVANRSFSRQLGVTQSVSEPDNHANLKNNGFTVNLPVAGPAGTLTASIISDTFSLNLALSAMESENDGEIISAPRVITTDGQKAIIKQGQEVPYTTQQGTDDPATTEFKEVVLNLTVTPHITPNRHVLLDMKLSQDTVAGYSQDGEPIIGTRSVQTQVLVDNNDTVVLGGIYQQKRNNTKNKIPILGDLPLVGTLFSGTSRQHKKQELLIFITPRILHETLTEH